MFFLFIDDLRSVVSETAKEVLFAYDVSLMSSHHNKQVAEKELQRAVIDVAEWSTSEKIVLNADEGAGVEKGPADESLQSSAASLLTYAAPAW